MKNAGNQEECRRQWRDGMFCTEDSLSERVCKLLVGEAHCIKRQRVENIKKAKEEFVTSFLLPIVCFL